MVRYIAYIPFAGRPRVMAGILLLLMSILYATFGRVLFGNKIHSFTSSYLHTSSLSTSTVLRSPKGKKNRLEPYLLSTDVHEICEDIYQACWEWKTNPYIRALSVEIVLIGNELYQQLPTVGYGGIETSVDNLASALYGMGIPFWAIVPKRKEEYNMPFRVRETAMSANGKGGLVGTYVNEVNEILHDEQIKGVPIFGTVPERAIKSIDLNKLSITSPELLPRRTFAVWGQSMWSQHFAENSAIDIVSHHDGGDPRKLNNGKWNWGHKNVRHRFLSYDQMSRWVVPNTENYARDNAISRVIPHGLPRDAYRLCEDKQYYLWVASLDWGWEEKGMDIFVQMARMRPNYKFIAYGNARARQDLVMRLYEIAKELPNFEYRGELKRGQTHFRMFCEATAFVMPTHESIGESFGMTVIESLSKGVPVIASTNGAVPEILAVEGRVGYSRYGTCCQGKDYNCYAEAADRYKGRTEADSEAIQEYAWRMYDVNYIVDQLLNYTITALREEKIIP